MIIHNCSQGSDEWFTARAGCITASMFKVARSKVNTLTDQQAVYVNAIKKGFSNKEALEQSGYKATPKAEAVTKSLNGEKVGELSDQAKNYAFKVAIERISDQPLDEGFTTWQARRGNELEPFCTYGV